MTYTYKVYDYYDRTLVTTHHWQVAIDHFNVPGACCIEYDSFLNGKVSLYTIADVEKHSGELMEARSKEYGNYGENNGPLPERNPKEEEVATTDFHGEFDKMTAEQQDAIINPKHYKMLPAEVMAKHPDGMEYIDLMAYLLEGQHGVQAHLLGQVYKYSMRLGKKDNKLQDAKKIEWYANRLVKEVEESL